MSDGVTLTPDDYHAMRASERDHLLAAALYHADTGDVPPRERLRETVDRLTGSKPGSHTTGDALDDLAERGYVEREDMVINGASARGVRVTATGKRVLAYGAARLDAAATVGGDE